MAQVGKIILIAGVVLVAVGLALWALGRLGFRGLPGDIRYESEGARIYLPIVTMIAASIILTILLNALLWLWRWWGR